MHLYSHNLASIDQISNLLAFVSSIQLSTSEGHLIRRSIFPNWKPLFLDTAYFKMVAGFGLVISMIIVIVGSERHYLPANMYAWFFASQVPFVSLCLFCADAEEFTNTPVNDDGKRLGTNSFILALAIHIVVLLSRLLKLGPLGPWQYVDISFSTFMFITLLSVSVKYRVMRIKA